MMEDKMKKLMEKRDGKELDPQYKAAKMSMLKALKDEMAGMMKGDLEGHAMKKVSVAAPDNDALVKGLDVAKEAVSGDDDLDLGDYEQAEPEEEDSSALSPEEEEMLAKLLARKGI